MTVPDNYDLTRLITTGYVGSHLPQPVPRCPVCDKETDTLFKYRDTGEIIGCNICIRSVDAWKLRDEQDG